MNLAVIVAVAGAGCIAVLSALVIIGRRNTKNASSSSSSSAAAGGARAAADRRKSQQQQGRSSGSYTNPVMDNIADPGCIRVGPTYYLCGTQRGGFAIFSSTNLRDWKQVADTGQGGCGQCWAPNFALIKGKYYLAFTDGGSFTSSVASASTVTGPYKLVCDKGIPGIDPYLFEHGGKVYCFYNPIKRGAIMACATMSSDLSRMLETKDLFAGPVPGLNQKEPTVEAPVCTKAGGTLYLSYSFNATGPNYNISYATAQHPLGPWKQSGETLLPDDRTGHGHHDIVRTPSGRYACVYHGAGGARNLCIDEATFRSGKMTIAYHPPGKQAPMFS